MTTSVRSISLIALSTLLFAGCTPKPAPAPEPKPPVAATTAANPSGSTSPVSITPTGNEDHHAYSKEQILTCTMSQCWQLSGKNEDSFFDIVQQLSTIAANNRGLSLPDDEAAGRSAGEYIKAQAKVDNQQILYAVVDAAVRKVSTPDVQKAQK